MILRNRLRDGAFGVLIMMMGFCMMGEVWYLSRRFFGKVTACVAVVLYVLIYSNYAGVVVNHRF